MLHRLPWLIAAILLASNAWPQQPRPTITSLNPPATFVGNAFTLTINATFFCAGTTVQFNGQNVAVMGSTANSLTVNISAALTAQPGTIPVVLNNPTAGGISGTCPNPGMTSLPFNFLILTPPPEITTGSLPAGTVGVAYAAGVTATGGIPPYTFALTGGSPPGLSLAPAGTLSGVPTQPGTFSMTIGVTDAASAQAARTIPITILNPPLQIITTTLPNASTGAAYATAFTASGGTAPFTWSTTSPLPPGMTLTSAGLLAGTTQQTGTYSITVSVVDSAQQTASRTFSLLVAAPLSIITTTLPQGFLTTPYSATLAATGGQSPYTWSIQGGAPPGLSLDAATGILTGSPVAEGVFNFNAEVRDAGTRLAVRTLQLVVGSAINITNSALRNGQVGAPYEEAFTATGGTAPYAWSIVGSAPPGLFLNPLGFLNGTPSLQGTFNLTVRVTDSLNQSATRSFSINITPQFRIVTEALPAATLGVFYEQTFTASGGSLPYFWQVTGASLPGLTLNNATGVLNGVPSSGGTFSFTILLSDSAGLQTSKSFTLNVNQGVRIAPETLSNATVGVAYSQTFTATGGTAPYNFQIVGSVPGLALDSSTGTLRGSPSQAGPFEFTIRATDATGLPGTRTYTLLVVSNLVIGTNTLAAGVERSSYSDTLTASGGTSPYSWRILTGTLPEGLFLNAAIGVISGTPLRAGTSSFTVEVSDNTGQRASRALTIAVQAGLAIQTEGTLAGGRIDSPYSATLAASGGSTPYTWSVLAGALPAGLQLNGATGEIAGTPSSVGRSTATVRVTDSGGRTAIAEIFITISPLLLRITSGAQLPNATAGVVYTFTAAATGGVPPYTWALNGAPPQLSIDAASGRISGRLLSADTLEFSVRVIDTAQVSDTVTLMLRSALPASPGVSLTGLPASGNPGQQLSPRLAIAQPYPLPLTGELNMTFEPAVGVDDPAIQFSTGGRRAVFNIPAGQLDAAFNAATLGIQTGTVAGTIRVNTRLTAAGGDVTPTPAPSTTITIARQAPVINNVRVNRTAAGFEVVVTAFATSREITSAAVRLQTTGTVQGTDFTIPIGAAVASFYQTGASQQFGSLCTITIPFNLQGNSGSVTSLAVTLTNAIGSSAAVSANF